MDRFAPHPVFSVGRHRRPGRHREPADLERGADEQRAVHRDDQRPFLHRDVLRRVRRGDPIAEPDAHPDTHADADRHPNTDARTDTRTHSDANPDSHADADAHAHTHADLPDRPEQWSPRPETATRATRCRRDGCGSPT